MSAIPSPSYPPELFNEYTTVFLGNALSCVFYGIYVVVAATNLVLLHRKRSHFLSFFTWSQLINTTVYVGISLSIATPQSLLILGLLSPDAMSPWPYVMVDIAFVMNTWFSDAFLLYRCYIVWMGNKYAVVVPALIYLATIGASIAYLWSSAHPGASSSTSAVQAFGRPYWTCSIALSVVVSCLIFVRLCLHRRAAMRAAMRAGSRQAQLSLSFMAMALESAVLYTAFGIVALVLFYLNSQLVNIFFPILGMVQVIAPGLIVNRIARDISFTTDNHRCVDVSAVHSAASPRKNNVETRQRDPELSVGSETVHSSSGTNCQTAPRNNTSTSVAQAVTDVV